jgi:hypothetical protein
MNATPPNAHATAAFGDRGVMVFAAEFDFGASHELSLRLNFSGTASISPSLEAFILPRFSLGSAFGLAFASGDGAHAFGFGAWPRLGYVFPFSKDLVFWPRAGVQLSTSTITVGDASTRTQGIALALYAPLSLLPLPGIEIGFGPTFFADMIKRESGGMDAPRGTTLGLAIEIGGWL